MSPSFDGEVRQLPSGRSFTGSSGPCALRRLADAALAEGAERLRLALEAADLGIWQYRSENGELFFDERCRTMWGLPGEGKLDFAAVMARVHSEDWPLVAEAIRQALAGAEGTVFRRELRVLWPDGSEHWIATHGRIHAQPDGAEPGFRLIGVSRDITQEKRVEQALRERERLYRAIGESIDYGVWVCDAEGRNIYASDSFLDMVGRTLDQCSNFGWREALHPDDVEPTRQGWRECVRTGGVWDIEQRFMGVDGEWHPVLARGVPVRDEQGEVLYWAGINLDISRLKKTEAALREGQAALQEVDRRKNDFLAVLSHELRNPLTPIRNSLFILDTAPPDGEQAQRARAIIRRQVGQLARLVDDLLDVTRIDRGRIQLRPRPCELNPLLRDILEDHRCEILSAGLQLEVQIAATPLWVNGDPTRLAQAIGNVLQNAAKFTATGGRVLVTLEADCTGGVAVLRVRDTGVGIAPEVLARLFEPFTQADQTLDRTLGGLGLGLALVKTLVEMHGGRIEARSDGLGRGAEFTLHLPLLEGEAAPTRKGGSATAARRAPRRVLIIEDSVDAAESLREALVFRGHQVELAFDGPQGIGKARTFKPELVLCDIGLPGMNGYQVARAIREDQELRSVRLVALTGYALPADVARAREAGFDEHLAKPAGLAQLEAVLAKASPEV